MREGARPLPIALISQPPYTGLGLRQPSIGVMGATLDQRFPFSQERGSSFAVQSRERSSQSLTCQRTLLRSLAGGAPFLSVDFDLPRKFNLRYLMFRGFGAATTLAPRHIRGRAVVSRGPAARMYTLSTRRAERAFIPSRGFDAIRNWIALLAYQNCPVPK